MSARTSSSDTPWARAFARARSSIGLLRSTPTTAIPASAVGTAMRPLPTPISSTGPPHSIASRT